MTMEDNSWDEAEYTHLIITCDDSEVSKKFVSSFVMDGMILHFQEQKNNVIFYKIVGNTENMSVN